MDDWGKKRGVPPVYRAAGVALNRLLSADFTGVHSLASISLPDTEAMMFISSLDRITPVPPFCRSPVSGRVALAGHRACGAVVDPAWIISF